MSTFEEQYKKYKQKKQAEEEAKKQKVSAFEQQYKRYRAQSVAEEITNRTNEWINSGGTLIDNYNARYKDGNTKWRGDAGEYYSSVYDAVNKQKSGAKEILDLIAQYGSNYDANWTKGIADTLAQNNSTYDQILKAAESDRDFWSQWESEDDYLTNGVPALQNAKYYAEYGDMDENTYNRELEKVKSQYDEITDSYAGQVGPVYYPEDISARYDYLKQYGEQMAPYWYDLEAGVAEIAEIESDLKEFERLNLQIIQRETAYAQAGMDNPRELAESDYDLQGVVARIKEISEKHGVNAFQGELSSLLAGKKVLYRDAEKAQNLAKLSSVSDDKSESYDPTFAVKAQYIPEYTGDVQDFASRVLSGNADLQYLIINDRSAYDELVSALDEKLSSGTATTEEIELIQSIYVDYSLIQHMSDDDKKLYNYYYSVGGKKAADEFLKAIETNLKYLEGARIADKLHDKPVLKRLYGVQVGLDQFASGMQGLFTDEYIEPSATQYAGQKVREDLADEGIFKWYNIKTGRWEDKFFGSSSAQMLYDIGQTGANMLPSILVAAAVEALLPTVGEGAALFGGLTASKLAGATVLGASAAGNAKNEMLEMGYSLDQARAYATMVGLSEAGLEMLLGGIPGLGGDGIFSGLGEKIIGKVDHAIAKAAIALGGNMLDEGLEEGLQTVLENWFKEISTGVDFEDPAIDEILYSSLLGALTAAGFGGGKLVGTTFNTAKNVAYDSRVGKSYVKKNGAQGVEGLVSKGLEMSSDTEAYKQAQKLQGKLDKGKKTSNYSVGRLYSSMSEAQISTAVQTRLTSEGVSETEARKLGNTVTDIIRGREVSNSKISEVIKNSAARTILNESIGAKIGASASVSDVKAAIKSYQEVKKSTKDRTAQATDKDGSAVKISGAGATFSMQKNADGGFDVVGEAEGESHVLASFKSQKQAEAAVYAMTLGMRSEGLKGLVTISESLPEGVSLGDAALVFNAIYNQGKSGKAMSAVRNMNLLSLEQRQYAYQNGIVDGLLERSRSEKSSDGVLQKDGESGKINKDKESTKNEQGVHIREGGKRNDGENTQGQVSAVESRARHDQSRGEDGGRPRDREAASLTYGEEVSAKSLGIEGGLASGKVYLIDDSSETASMKKARERAEKRGLKTIFFAGGNLEIEQNGKIASARAYIEGDKVFVRVDHSDFTSDQLMRHEIGHDMIAKGEIAPDSVIERLEEIYTADEIEKIREQYAIAYKGSGMSAEEIWVEIICDSLGDMNVFATKQVGKATGEFLSALKSTTEADMKPARAPPTVTEGKASREISEFLIYNFNGFVYEGAGIELGYDIKERIASAIKTGYGILSKSRSFGRVYLSENNNFYIFDFNEDGSVTIEGILDSDIDGEFISIVEEVIKNDGSGKRNGTALSWHLERFRNGQEYSNNNFGGDVSSYGTNEQTDALHSRSSDGNSGRGGERSGKVTKNTAPLNSYLPVKQKFVDVAGYTRNVLGIGNGEYMVQGTHKNNYKFNSIEEAIAAENENIIKRYVNKYGKTVSWVKNRLTDDPDFLKKERRNGKKFTSIELTNLDAFEDVDVDSDNDVQYSKGNNAEWDAERIKDGKVEKAKPISEIIEQIRHDFGINITKGHVRGKNSLGQYSKRNHGIRTKIANDLPTVSHELGHALDQRYQLTDKSRLTKEMRAELESALGGLKDAYKQNLWVSEGLAEYIRRFLQNRDDAARAYPEFTKHFINSLSNADRILMDTFADEINAYYALDGDTATSSIRLREEGLPDARTPLEKAREMGDDIYQAWVDANHGIKLFDEATGASTYKLASNAAYSDAIAGQIITGELTDANGQYVAPGLKAALEGVDIGNKKVYHEFGEYLVVRHGPERLKEGMMIFADARKNTASFMAKRAAELEAAHPEFKVAADRLYEFQKQFLKTWAVDTGLIPAEIAEAWAKRWAYYVPLNRAVGKAGMIGAKRGYANQNSTIKKAIGSGLDIVHPVDNIINNIVKMVNVGVRNNVMLAITEQADKLGADATFLEKVPTPMKKKTADLTDVKAKLHDAFGAAGIGELLAEVEKTVDSEIQARINEEDKTAGRITADFIDEVIRMQDKVKRSKRRKRVGLPSSAHIKQIESLMKTINGDFSADGYEIWIDGTAVDHLIRRHGEMGAADQSMASRAVRELIPWVINNPDSGEFIRNSDGTLELSNRYFNADGSKAPQIRLQKQVDGDTIYVSECVPDSVNKRIYITSAYIKKGSTDQLLNIAPVKGTPQPTSETSFDGSTTNNSVAHFDKVVNKNFSTNSNSAKSGAWSQIDEIIESAIDDVLIQYGQGKAHGDVVTVLRNGKEEFWKINDALLLESLTNLSQKKVSGILEAYSVVSRFMTSNITGNNIIWSIFSNFPRDMMTFFTYSKNKNPLKAFASMGEAYLNKVTDGIADTAHKAYIYEYYGLGGGQTSAYTADVDLAKRARKKLKHSSKLQSAAYYANPLNTLSFISETVESGPRIATYIMMREQGMSPQDAFYESQDITVNFKRGGRMSRELNRAVPFFNASVQGLDKFARWVTCEDVPKAQRAKAIVGRVTMYVAVSAALGALFYALNNSDDEDEENYRLLSNYTKNSYWNVPLGDGKYFAIPKPREIAVLSTFVETTCEYFGGNDYAYEGFGEYVADNFLPPFLSDFATNGFDGALGSLGIIGVASDLRANKDFLGRPIESTSLSGYESQDRYTRRTSKIAYWLGQAAAELGLDWSPVQIDYFFGQTLGGYWKVQKALFPVGSENIDWTLGVQNTYVKDNQYSNDIVNWLYDEANASEQAKASNPDDMHIAIDAKLDSNMKSFYSRYYALTKGQKEDSASRRAKRVVLDMIVEYRKATDNGDRSAAEKAVYEIVSVCKNTSLLPSVMQSTVKDSEKNEYKLTDIQYVEYQTTYNGLYWGFIEDNLDVNASDAEKVAIIKQAQSIAKERATEKALRNASAGSSGFFEKYSDVDDKDIITFKAQMDLADDDGSLKQPEVIDIIEAMVDNGLSKEDAYTLFKSKYPESDKNNPWRRYAP